MRLSNPCIRCATELDSFQVYWCYTSLLLLLVAVLLTITVDFHFVLLFIWMEQATRICMHTGTFYWNSYGIKILLSC